MMEIRVRFLAVALSAATLFAPAVAQEKQGGEKKEGNAPPAAAQQQKPPPAKVMVVKPQTVIVTENLPARLEASREAVIQPQVSGIVQKRLFEEGSLVRAGQQLYQIDDAVYQANLQSAKAQLSLAQANKALAQSTANRYAPLVKEKAVSRQTYDQARDGSEGCLRQYHGRGSGHQAGGNQCAVCQGAGADFRRHRQVECFRRRAGRPRQHRQYGEDSAA
jgi:efflux transporter, RND family, MFP subunit